MITPTLAILRQKLADTEFQLAVARHHRHPSPAVAAALHADAAALRAQIAEAQRRRLERCAP